MQAARARIVCEASVRWTPLPGPCLTLDWRWDQKCDVPASKNGRKIVAIGLRGRVDVRWPMRRWCRCKVAGSRGGGCGGLRPSAPIVSLRREQEGCNAPMRGLRTALGDGGILGQFATSRRRGDSRRDRRQDLQLDVYSSSLCLEASQCSSTHMALPDQCTLWAS